MRPEILFPLFAPVTRLPGVGPRIAKLVERVAGPHVVDLFWHVPVGLIDRRYAPTVDEAIEGRVATLTVTVDRHQPSPPRNPRVPYRVRCFDDTGSIQLVFFHGRADYLKRLLPEGAARVVSGTIERFGSELQMTHPDFIATPQELAKVQTVQPVYGLTGGLSLKVLGKAIEAALARAPDLPEWQNAAYKEREGWPGWRAALHAVHKPQELVDLEPSALPRRRLAYDELLASQLAIALARARMRHRKGRPIRGNGRLRAKVLQALHFSLTGSQSMALAEIDGDMASDKRMLRLLQGDVGSGKTVVAFLAMLSAVESGAQAALMAPTDILARQHYRTIAPLAAAAGIEVALLTGRHRGSAREAQLQGLANGAVALAVGTHALFQEDVAFHNLALAVIDEQHRFGVHQRMMLAGKGAAVDMLVMTATPIPRTLMLAAYGDLDESRLTEKPPGRQPIDTRAMPLEKLDQVVDAVGRAMDGGAKVYWVCPLVEETEDSGLAAVTERHATLKARYGERVGVVHGRMKGPDKDKVMNAFADGDVDLLVATTVIEVGVDVPEATVMVVEDAERFGLAQLHQLRGRIGRGDKPSTCLLLYASPVGATAKARLKALRDTDDGFVIAEQDLKLRGAGDVLGTKQSGLPGFRLADLAVHGDLLATARDDARLIVETDPELRTARGEALRTLLYLFERDAAILTARAG